MHGSHCYDDDGTLTCGWPEYHAQGARPTLGDTLDALDASAPTSPAEAREMAAARRLAIMRDRRPIASRIARVGAR